MPESIAHFSGLYTPMFTQEQKLEGLIAGLAPYIFPDHVWVDFKVDIRHPGGIVRADAALVARDCSHWYIIEVELLRHDWRGHIRPQLDALLHGFYGERHRTALMERVRTRGLPDIGLASLPVYDPLLLLVIDSAPEIVQTWCRDRGIDWLETSPFRSVQNQYALAIRGLRPLPEAQRVSQTPISVSLVLSDRSDLLPVLNYRSESRIARRTDSFSVIIGDKIASARNVEDWNALVLGITLDQFGQTFGNARSFRMIGIEPPYQLQRED